MNAVLLYPEFPDTFWSFKYALKFIRKKASLPPLGLLTVASLLPSRWQLRLVDLNIRSLIEADLAWADCLLISAMDIQRESARRAIHRARAAGLKIIAGGPLFSSDYEAFPEVDHFVLDEAEITLPDFLADLEAGSAKKIYRAGRFPDVRNSPVPCWGLIRLKEYASACIQFSRGCPFHCEFCNVTALFGHRVRTKSTNQVLTELDCLYDRGWRGSIFFVDDNFIGNKARLKRDLLPALARWRRDKPRITFYTETSINLADDEELMELMTSAGFDTVFIGIETPDDRSLDECSKKQNRNRDLLADVRRLQHHGLQVQGGFIVGFDSDTPSIFQRQIEFIQQSGIVTAMVGMLQAPTGTPLYARLQREGRLLGRTSGNNVDLATNILPRMGLDSLHEGYRQILDHIYSSDLYYQRIRTLLFEYRSPGIKTRLDLQHKLAFFRSVYHLGIRGRDRLHYWKLMFWTLRRRPRLLPQAVTLAIYGFHFRKVCRLRLPEAEPAR